jgi:DNA anti-recombination protein RmuC
MGEKDADRAKDGLVEELTEAVQEYYEAAVESAAAMQDSNAQLARRFYENSAEALETQVEINRHTLQSLAKMAREQREVFRRLSRESLDAYDGFLDSLFSYHKEVLREPEAPGG